jgi:predicted MPP superfamily phosphohydrolase
MRNWFTFVLFITIVSAVYFGIHYFVYKSLTRTLVQAPGHQKALKWLFWVSGASFMVSIFLSRQLGFHLFNWYAYVWMGVISIAFTFFLVQWIVALIFPSQTKTLAAGALIVIGLISLYSLINGLLYPSVKRLTIPMKNLPQSMSGFKLVLLSDLHMESFKSHGVLVNVVEKVNALKPDLVAITGDLLDGTDPMFCEQLKRVKATHGVIAVTGNHEFYVGMQNFLNLTQCANIMVLRNRFTTIAGTLQVIGLEDDQGRGFDTGGPDLDAATAEGYDPSKPTVMLYHRPLHFDEAVEKGVGLQLAGHTHAGQIPPMDLIVQVVYKYPFGLYEREGSYIYTTSGTGYWGPPMRFLNKNEIVLFTLESKK